MTDDELEVWRRQWRSQPQVPLELIRKVERETVNMRLSWISQILPALIGAATIVGAVITQNISWILLAGGTWVFILIGWYFLVQNYKGVWEPSAATTAAYVELSIERCRRTLNDIRFSIVMMWLLTAFVFIADYQILKGTGGLTTTSDFLIVAAAFAFATVIVSIVFIYQIRKRRRTKTELEYLLNLRAKLETDSKM